MNSLTPHRGQKIAPIFGCKMRLDLSDQIQRNIYLGTFEPRETRMLLRHLLPGMTFVDVGANVGYFTALAASRVGAQGQVLAIEPSPKAFSILQEMIERNFGGNVQAAAFAVGSKPGELNLYIPPDSFGNHTPTLLGNPEGQAVPVKVTTLDRLAMERGISKIDLLKIDVEGFEMEAFRGASELLKKRRIRAVLCEFNDFWLKKAGVSSEVLYQFLTEAGFQVVGGDPVFRKDSVVNCFMINRLPIEE